ncbi:MAG TPA: hypothetical protein PKO16_02090 [Bacteroidia bacterium]|jgi:hypothetical protein|nr:hypothetical protein [Bacteroidia bacterium]
MKKTIIALSVFFLIAITFSLNAQTNKIAKFNSITMPTGLNQSIIFDDGTNVGLGTITPADKFHIHALGGGIIRLTNNNTSYLTSQTVTTGNIRNIAMQWNNNYSATNINETSAIKFTYRADVNGQVQDAAIRFFTQNNGSGVTQERMTIVGGNVGIGTTSPGSFKLAVEGKIGAREFKVTAASPWPDYVFESSHKLMSINDLENYLSKNKHLPNIPSAQDIQEDSGVNLGDMQIKHLEKTEELYLYIIELNKKIEMLENKLASRQ